MIVGSADNQAKWCVLRHSKMVGLVELGDYLGRHAGSDACAIRLTACKLRLECLAGFIDRLSFQRGSDIVQGLHCPRAGLACIGTWSREG